MLRQRKQKCKEIIAKGSRDSKEPSNCIICLDKVSCRGKLSVCDHWFCFPCVLEWSKNTNTCPICKARFRVITKIHLSTLKSPPQKIRVPDKDQRVWDDDETLTPEQILDILNDDDFDDDYEPPAHIDNPWTMARMDEDDFDSSFIDDTGLIQVDLTVDELSEDETSEGSYICSASTSQDRRYALRSARQSAVLEDQTVFCDDEFSDVESDRSSIATTDSFIVNDEDSDDEGNDWIPFRNIKHCKKASNTKGKKQTLKKPPSKHPSRAKKNTSVKTTSRHAYTTRTSNSSQASQKKQKQALGRRVVNDPDGWIDMSRNRPRETSITIANTEPSTSGIQTRNNSKQPRPGGKLQESSYQSNSNHNIRQRRPRKAKLNGFTSEGDQDSGNSDTSDCEELSLRAGVKRKKEINSSSGSEDFQELPTQPNTPEAFITKDTRKKGYTSYLSLFTRNAEYESEAFIEPSPHVGKKRSIFTRRHHKSPANLFGDSDDASSPLKLRPFEKGSQKRNKAQGSESNDLNAPKRNLMQHRAFESKNLDNLCTEKLSKNQVSTSSKQHGINNEMEQFPGALCKDTDQRYGKRATKKIKPKKKRILLLDSDSD